MFNFTDQRMFPSISIFVLACNDNNSMHFCDWRKKKKKSIRCPFDFWSFVLWPEIWNPVLSIARRALFRDSQRIRARHWFAISDARPCAVIRGWVRKSSICSVKLPGAQRRVMEQGFLAKLYARSGPGRNARRLLRQLSCSSRRALMASRMY